MAPNTESERAPKYIHLGTLNGPVMFNGRNRELWACGDCGCAVAARMTHDQVCVGRKAQIGAELEPPDETPV